MTQPDIVLYGTALSGHCHRVELMLRALGLAFRFEEAPGPVRQSPPFRALNPLGQIPVLRDGDLVLADSNAILVYLVRRYAPDSRWIPADPVEEAQVQRWLSISAGEVRFGPGVARVALQWGMPGDPVAAGEIGRRLLTFMDGHLDGRSFLATDYPTIADLACYSYVAHAPEGAIPLDPYPHVRAWLKRVEALPFFKPMPASPIPAAPLAATA